MLLAIFGIGGIGFAGYTFMNKKKKEQEAAKPDPDVDYQDDDDEGNETLSEVPNTSSVISSLIDKKRRSNDKKE